MTRFRALDFFWIFFLSILLGGFTLTIAGRFSAIGVLGIAALVTVGFILFSARNTGEKEGPPSPWALAALGMAMGSLFFTLPAGEWIPGGWDPSVYLQTGAQIEQSGGLLFDHPDLISTPPELQEILYRDLHGIQEPFGGMRIYEGKVTPQFYHVYPVLLALFISMGGGLAAALLVNPLLNVLSICLMYQLARMWTGKPRWGFLAALVLMLFPGQIWQAKFSTAEMLTQVLILGGFLFLKRWSRDPVANPVDALLAGLSLGVALLTRYDTLMLWMVLVPVLCFFAGESKYRKGLFLFFVSLIPITLLWFQHQKIAPYYSPLGPMVFKLVGVSAGLSLCTLIAGYFPGISTLIRKFRKPLLCLLTLAWWGWMVVNWQIRPELHPDGRLHAWLQAIFSQLGLGSFLDSFFGPAKVSMLYLESLFHPLGLLLVLLLVPALWWTAQGPVKICWAFSGAAVALVLTWEPMNDLFMMWVSRRFNPLVIPWLILGSVVGLHLLQDKLISRKYKWIPTGLLILIVGLQIPSSRFMMVHRDWPGVLHWFETVAQAVPAEAELYTDQTGFGAPFRFIWKKHAFELRRQNEENLRILLDYFQAHPPKKPIYFFSTSSALAAEPGWRRVDDFPLESSILVQPRTQMPDATRSRGGDFSLYRLDPKSE